MSLIRVSPTEPNPTHDISLSDGVKTIGLHLIDPRGNKDRRAIRQVSTPRTSLQIQQGDPDYSGFNLPYTPVTQKDWSGGRGQYNFRKDATRYYDSQGIDTRFGDMILGPAAIPTSGYTNTQTQGAGADSSITYGSTYYPLASPFTPAAAYACRSLVVRLKRNSAGTSNLNAAIWSDSAGAPGAQLAQSSWVNVTSTTPIDVTFPISYNMAAGTTYWIVIFSNGDGDVAITYDTVEAGKKVYYNNLTMSAWTQLYNNASLYIQVRNIGAGKVNFFNYRDSEMALFIPDDNGACSLFLNGHHGYASSNANDKTKLNMTIGITGTPGPTVAKLVSGPGSHDDINWRNVAGYTNTGSADVVYTDADNPWNTTHSSTTEFALLGENTWYEITGHGLSKSVTDVLVYNDIIYFAFDDDAPIRRGKYTGTGSMADPAAWSWADDATNKGTYLRAIPTNTAGGMKIWAVQAYASKVSNADPQPWGTNLVFTAANGDKTLGNPATRVTGVAVTGDPRVLWIFKEDSFGSISNDIYAEVPVSELAAAISDYNGKAAIQAGVYLYFSLGEGYERFYNQSLDDMGPNRDEGLPADRRGPIVHAVPYPGGIVACVDAGAHGYSSILFFNGLGWHELYRGGFGERIRHAHVQVIPGARADRLWFSQGQDIYWLPISITPLKDSDYTFTSSGSLITSWFTTGFAEIKKFWRSLAISAQNLGVTGISVTLEYQLDDAADSDPWITVPGAFDKNNKKALVLSTDYSTTGRLIRFRITLSTTVSSVTPRIRATTIETVTRVPPSRQWGLTFQADDVSVSDADGETDSLDMYDLLDALETWADSETQPGPLHMHSVIKKFDDKWVFIDAPNITPREVSLFDDRRNVKAIGSLNLTEA